MSKQKWLFHGCSMAADYFEPMFRWENLPWDPEQHDNRSYPYWLAQKYDIDFVNLAEGGNDNSTILTECIDHITHNDDISGVCIGLSGWERFTFFGKKRNVNTVPHVLIKKFMDEGKITKDDFFHTFKERHQFAYDRFQNEVNKLSKLYYHEDVILSACGSMAHDETSAVRFWTHTLMRLVTLQKVCDMKNIPLIVAQNIPPLYDRDDLHDVLRRCENLTPEDRRLVNDVLQDNEYVRLVVKTSRHYKTVDQIAERGDFWGWPFFDEWGGSVVSRSSFFRLNGKVHISRKNRHWNKKGHQLVVDKVYGPMIEKYL